MKKHSAVIPPPALSWVVSFSVKHHLEPTPEYEMHYLSRLGLFLTRTCFCAVSVAVYFFNLV